MRKIYFFASSFLTILAIYFTLTYIGASSDNLSLLGCSAPQNACDQVAKSHWAYFLGIPVAYLGGITYVCFLLSTFLFKKQSARWLSLFLGYLIIIGAIWFVFIQAFIIKQFCTQCCLIHALAATASILYIFQNKDLNKMRAFSLALISISTAAIIQFYHPSKVQGQRKTTLLDSLQVSANTNSIVLYDGSFVIEKKELPLLIQSNTETNKFSLFLSDYTCPHCLSQHITYFENAEELNSYGSIYHLPCYQSKESKELSRILLIVSRVDKEIYIHLLKQLRDGNISSRVSEVRELASKQLNGNYDLYYKTFFAWSERILLSTKQLMQLNQEHAQASTYPQLMIGNKLIEGALSLDDYQAIAEATSSIKQLVTDPKKPLASASSKLVFKESSFHLGTITKNQLGHGKLHIKNTSEQTVHIEKTKTSCGCIEILDNISEIGSGETATIPFHFSTKKFLGPVTHKIFIYEQGIQKPTIIPVSVDVWLPFRIFPYKNNLGKVTAESTTQMRKISFINSTKAPVALELVSNLVGYIDAKLETIIEGAHYELSYQITRMPDHVVNTKLTLKTSHPNCPEITIPISAMNASLYEITPSAIAPKSRDSQKETQHYFRCYDQSIISPEITSIQYKGTQLNQIKIDLLAKKHPSHPPGFSIQFKKEFNHEQAVKSKEYLEINTSFLEKPVALYFASGTKELKK